MNWGIRPVSELCTYAIDCVNKTAPLSEVETPYKMLRTTNIKDGYIDFDNVRYVEKDVFDKWTRRAVPKYGDVLFTREAPVGEVGRFTSKSENYFLGQRTFLYRANPNKLDWNYLAYILQSPQIQGWVNGIAYGATVPHLKVGDMEHLMIPVPPLPTQKKIAKILSNYDDLIENNLKRIKLLEESARLTYEEWFLRFRVDGKKLEIDPESGLPFGWERLRIEDYLDILSKGPSLNYDLGGARGVPVLNQSCIRNGEIELTKLLVAKELNDKNKSSYLRINDILINSMGKGTLGRVSKNVSIDTKMIIHNCITYLRAKDIYSQYMLFYFISAHQQYFESIAIGATGQSTLKKELISNLVITLPDQNCMNRYDLILSSIWNKTGLLKKQNQLLKEARDILLPRLMTGMIDTDDIEVTA